VFLFFHHTDSATALHLLTGGTVGEAPLGALRKAEMVPLFTSLWLFFTAIPLVVIDLRHRLLPDVITLPGTAVALALGAVNPDLGLKASLLGAGVGAGGLLLVAKGYELLRRREGMGLGDVKYLGLIGAVVGWQGVFITLGIASFLGALVGVSLGLIRREGLQAAIPFGPFLAIAALVVNLWGDQLQVLFYG
jgi:leader peptidase (prepilin peptidase)/N-methyltransferase